MQCEPPVDQGNFIRLHRWVSDSEHSKKNETDNTDPLSQCSNCSRRCYMFASTYVHAEKTTPRAKDLPRISLDTRTIYIKWPVTNRIGCNYNAMYRWSRCRCKASVHRKASLDLISSSQRAAPAPVRGSKTPSEQFRCRKRIMSAYCLYVMSWVGRGRRKVDV